MLSVRCAAGLRSRFVRAVVVRSFKGRQHGAATIEGFPFARGVKVGRESMVGVEAMFALCGFGLAGGRR